MGVTILHISDLHRDSGSQLTTTTLLQSLLRDRERYLDEGRAGPDLAVISGDIVYGVRADENDANQKLCAQYDEALEFLIALADNFFDGNREKLILVPGNHDVSMPHVKKSLQSVDIPQGSEEKKQLTNNLFKYDTKFRWDWKNFFAYEIINENAYAERMKPFSDFYNRFYQGKRTYSLDPSEQYSIHDYPELELSFLALSSCHQNDLYNRAGRIHPEALANSAGEMLKLSRLGRLGVAVWHHNIQGGPNDNDYADPEFLQILMDGMCSIGMHGHQHKPQILEHRFSADQKQGISIISAGTLCGGPHSLPSGRSRSYNIVELDIKERKGMIFARGMTNNDFSNPVWAKQYIPDLGGDSVEFKLVGKIKSPDTMAIAIEADTLNRSGQHVEAFEVARKHLSDSFIRRIALDALIEMNDWKKITENFSTPTNSSEFIALSTAFEELKKWSDLKNLHSSPIAFKDDIAVKQRIEMMKTTLQRI